MKHGAILVCWFAAASLAWGEPPNIPPLDEKPPAEKPSLATQTVAELFSPSATEEQDTRPLRLVDVLGSIPDQQRQMAAVLDYWELSGKSALLAQARRNQAFLEKLAERVAQGQPDALQATALSAALSSAKANLTQQLIEVREARQPFQRANPTAVVPVDLPHAAGYETQFEKLFPDGNAPAYATLLHRALPIRLAALNARAEAVQAAEDYLTAVAEDFQQGQAQLITVLDSHRELSRQQEAFIKTVWQYNRDIARYAMPLARRASSPNRLASMLIKVPPRQADARSRTVRKQVFSNERETAEPSGWKNPNEAKQAPKSSGVIRDSNVRPAAFQPQETSLLGSWAKLTELPSDQQRKLLTEQFLAAGKVDDERLQSCRLQACLATVPLDRRREVIAEFWTTAKEAALWQWQRDAADQLDRLQTQLLPILNAPADARQMLYLQVHRLEASANTHNQALRMWYACYRLTRATGAPTDQPWRIADGSESFAFPSADQSSPSLLWQQTAAALIASDRQVQAHLALLNQGRVDLPRLLSSMQWQTAHSREFLDAFVDAQVAAMSR